MSKFVSTETVNKFFPYYRLTSRLVKKLCRRKPKMLEILLVCTIFFEEIVTSDQIEPIDYRNNAPFTNPSFPFNNNPLYSPFNSFPFYNPFNYQNYYPQYPNAPQNYGPQVSQPVNQQTVSNIAVVPNQIPNIPPNADYQMPQSPASQIPVQNPVYQMPQVQTPQLPVQNQAQFPVYASQFSSYLPSQGSLNVQSGFNNILSTNGGL